MTDSNPAQVCLGSDVNGSPMKEKWGYPSLDGMLLYLLTNTRLDITYAVSQVACFGSNPKQSHASAIKIIVRYLAGTADKGVIFTPNDNFKINCYVDANFTGLHGQESENNPLSARLRTGYILFFCGCPLLQKSQLQSETALSTYHMSCCARPAVEVAAMVGGKWTRRKKAKREARHRLLVLKLREECNDWFWGK